MQIFSSEGYENGRSQGLDYIKGQTKKIKINNQNNVLPFVGYFDVNFKINENYLKKFDNSKFYFVHSYYVKKFKEKNYNIEFSKNGDIEFCAFVNFKNLYLFQFHPEISSIEGIKIYKNFKSIIKK